MNTLTFAKFIQEGTNYEIGQQRGKILLQKPETVKFLTSLPQDSKQLTTEQLAERLAVMEQWCPGVAEELHGLADGLGVAMDQLIHLSFAYQARPSSCSMLAILPSKSDNGHTYFARSYEYNTEDELVYSVTRVPNHYAHAGFSLFQVGRFDGINEKGLCVAMNSLEVVHSSVGKAAGLAFWLVLRSVLDNCADIEEAIRWIEPMPIASNMQMLFADPSGQCAVVEILNSNGSSTKAIRREKASLGAFNHYRSEQHRKLYPEARYFSAVREHAVQQFLQEHEKVSQADLKALLTAKLPEGLCCHAYSNWFGTLRSQLFDVTDHKMLVCFGSPQSGNWFTADLAAPAEYQEYEIAYTDEKVADYYWQKKDLLSWLTEFESAGRQP